MLNSRKDIYYSSSRNFLQVLAFSLEIAGTFINYQYLVRQMRMPNYGSFYQYYCFALSKGKTSDPGAGIHQFRKPGTSKKIIY